MHLLQPKHVPRLPFQHKKHNIIHLLQSPSITIHQIQQIHSRLIQLPSPSSSSSSSLYLFNSLLFAYAGSSLPTHAFGFYATRMGHLAPNHSTFQFLLRSSAKSKSFTQTTQLHSKTKKLGFDSYIFLQNALLNCYCMSGQLSAARLLFDEMAQRDAVTFNTMVHGYAELGDMDTASQIFSQIPAPNIICWTAMVVGFSDRGDILAARRFFDAMPDRDVASWNAMISSYVQNQQPMQALHLFCHMQSANFKPNSVTIASALSACASIGALDTGKCIHGFLSKNDFRLGPVLGTALIDMYSKCGEVEWALDVFRKLQEKNSSTWNAMINGLAMNGYGKQALDLFDKMKGYRNVRPDEVTLIGVLLACSHGGFIEEGRKHFYFTAKEYNISLLVQHYTCVVDLLARHGLLNEAEEIIRHMPIQPDVVLWRALLGGCRLHKNVQLAEKILSKMEAQDSGDYVLLSNLYASLGRWDEVDNVRKRMKEKGIIKTPGCSSIVVENTIHEFISGDKSHPRYVQIHEKLEEMGRKLCREGYSAETSEVLYDVDDEEKEEALGCHSEKLAIALGLMSTTPWSTLRIVKNLRFCRDCHNFTKLVSKIYNRQIVVRDRVRFHHFRGGDCSCNDYW